MYRDTGINQREDGSWGMLFSLWDTGVQHDDMCVQRQGVYDTSTGQVVAIYLKSPKEERTHVGGHFIRDASRDNWTTKRVLRMGRATYEVTLVTDEQIKARIEADLRNQSLGGKYIFEKPPSK